jgi:hypothetical protein
MEVSMKKFLCAILVINIFLTSTNPLFSSTLFELNFKKHSGTSAAVRSLVLPGWGQYYNEQTKKAYIMFSATMFSLFCGIYFYNQSEQTYKKYEEKGLVESYLYKDYETQLNTANVFFVLSAISWGYNIVDAYINGEKYRKKYWSGFENNKFVVKFKF